MDDALQPVLVRPDELGDRAISGAVAHQAVAHHPVPVLAVGDEDVEALAYGPLDVRIVRSMAVLQKCLCEEDVRAVFLSIAVPDGYPPSVEDEERMILIPLDQISLAITGH